MYLDRIDIDHHGLLNRVELGPFSEHLNVVCTPIGSGKTAIARFIRDSLVRRDYPLGMMSSSAGRVVWSDRNGKIHCRREQDGTPEGRRTVEFESRGDITHRFDWLHGTWMDGVADTNDASRALGSVQLSEAIADGILTDTTVSSVARVLASCRQCGLTDPTYYASVAGRSSSLRDAYTKEAHDHSIIREELASIEVELASLEDPSLRRDREERRRTLLHHLAILQSQRSDSSRTSQSTPSVGSIEQLHGSIWRLRVHKASLSRWIDYLKADREAIRTKSDIPIDEIERRGQWLSRAWGIDSETQNRLRELDAQILAWRRLISELRGIDQLLSSDAVQEQIDRFGKSFSTRRLSDQELNRERLNHFLGSLDQSFTYPYSFVASGHSSRRNSGVKLPNRFPDELDLRIESAVGLLQRLGDMLSQSHDRNAAWFDGGQGQGELSGRSLRSMLNAIRDALESGRYDAFEFEDFAKQLSGTASFPGIVSIRSHVRTGISPAISWSTGALEQLLDYRVRIVRQYELSDQYDYSYRTTETGPQPAPSPWYTQQINIELASCEEEFSGVSRDLDGLVARAVDLRKSGVDAKATRVSDEDQAIRASRREEVDAILRELQELDAKDNASERTKRLHQRRTELIEQLGSRGTRPAVANPLADEASRWLVRLSAGRLRKIEWQSQPASESVLIDGREAVLLPASDRALATLALRFAAADALAQQGTPVPLIIETHRELASGTDSLPGLTSMASAHAAVPVLNPAFFAAVEDFAALGRQVILLTSDRDMADEFGRRGSAVSYIRGERLTEPHRPLWQAHYASESYTGPHAAPVGPSYPASTYPHAAPLVDSYDSSAWSYDPTIWYGESWAQSPSALPDGLTPGASYSGALSNASYHSPQNHSGAYYGEVGVGEVDPTLQSYRDGYYHAEQYTTTPVSGESSRGESTQQTRGKSSSPAGPPATKKRSPFFLSVDSPIDQAPSVDAIGVARLRRCNVTHITHLMQQDPNRLADALGLSNVTASTIRRWQSECRLMCHVPNLRGFDARILVGCGIRDATQLSGIRPMDLLDRVEAFLATERGQRILLSGTSYELSRITSWIATANVAADNQSPFGEKRETTSDARSGRNPRRSRNAETNDASEGVYEFVSDDGESVRVRSPRSRRRSEKLRRSKFGSSYRNHGASGQPRASSGRGHSANDRPALATASVDHSFDERDPAAEADSNDASGELRFYLHRDSPVVDAPSIGTRMSEKLEAIGIETVNDLLEADPAEVADSLEHRRVDAETVTAWQLQATLVCRIPMLRGHDARLLVAADVTSPEEVAAYEAQELLDVILPIAKSNEGQRILRGSQLPDLEEVTDWIGFAGQNRDLAAA